MFRGNSFKGMVFNHRSKFLAVLSAWFVNLGMKIRVVKVQSLGKYNIHAVFNDGTEGDYDVSDMAGKGLFKIWETPGYFDRVFINPDNNAIAWNEDLEIDTLNCYLHIKGISFDEYRVLSKQNTYAFS